MALADEEEDGDNVAHLVPEEGGAVEIEGVDCGGLAGMRGRLQGVVGEERGDGQGADLFNVGVEDASFEIC